MSRSRSSRRLRKTKGQDSSASILQGIESLEDRRLLSVSPNPVADHNVPLDTSDWTQPIFSQRMGGYDAAEIFNLQSKPDSNFTIYLDFDGHATTGTSWNFDNGIDTIVSPPFDLDGDSTTFSQTELERVLVSWQQTADDFAPFDINVTTRDPGVDALINSGGGDPTWGARAIVTVDTFADCGCGGFAYVGSFNDNVDTPTFVFNHGPSSMSETFSHEVGHMLGLFHDGNSSQSYYPGHGAGETSWGTIMGAAFDENVTHWNEGDYFDADNNQDDLSIITNNNGFDYRTDDYGDSIATAEPIDVTNNTTIDAYGIIETGNDRDYFSFETGGGDLSLSIDPLAVKPNLDVFAALYDASGNLIQLSNPGDQLAGSITANVSAGTYYLRVEGVGSDAVYNSGSDTVSDPIVKPWQSSSPTGYSDYGSLGQYTVSGEIVAAGNDTFSIVATDAVKTEGDTGVQPFTFTVTRTGNTAVPASVDFEMTAPLPSFVGESNPDSTNAADFAGGTIFNDTLNFAANETSKTITFNVVGDTDFERDESFVTRLGNASSNWFIENSRATGTILSDENLVGVSSLSTADDVNEGPFNGALVRWRQIAPAGPGFDEWAIDNISLSNSTLADDFDPDIDNSNWSTVSGGVVSNQFGGSGNALTMNGISDRRLVTNLLNASPGDLLSFDIIFGDGSNGGENVDEGEDVVVEFSLDGGSNWQQFDVFDSEDHTSWTSVQATLPTAIDTNPPSELTFTLVRAGGIGLPITVDWAVDTVGVSDPVNGLDFVDGVLPTGQVSFAAGDSTAQLVIPVNADIDFELDERFRVVLTSGSGAGTVTLDSGASQAFGTIANDDAGYNVNPGPMFRIRQLDNSGSGFDNWAVDNFNYTGGQLTDDFDPDIDGTQWSEILLGVVNSNFGGSGNSLFFDGGGERSMTTRALDAQFGDTLSFDFIYGDDFNGGENPEPGDEVVIEYSIDGGDQWTNLQTFNFNIVNWTTVNIPVPTDAVRPPTMLDEGATFDFDVQRFGVDTSSIESVVTWQVVGSGANPADANDFPGGVFPSGTLTFAPGEQLKSVSIDSVDDGSFEPDETFEFVVNAMGGNSNAAGTLLNNDTATSGDFDNDGDYDCDDIDALINNIANQTNVATYDMNGDGALDLADRDDWLAVAGSINLPSGNSYLLGDATLDGSVDGGDFLAWNSHKFTSGAGWCGGDFNADGNSDGGDFLIWNSNKFSSSDAAAAFVPKSRLAPASKNMAPGTANMFIQDEEIVTAGIVDTAARKLDTVRETDAAISSWRRTSEASVASPHTLSDRLHKFDSDIVFSGFDV